jgi:cyclic beta-1,2-glucan synthetase
VSADDRAYLRTIAQRTWSYFEEFVGAENNFLPPDNIQVSPVLTVAHRTSPTNIGLGLLSTLAAHDLEFIDTPGLLRRIDETLTTVERLDKYEGHLFNWYDTKTLAPLSPAYVSTVDSGNLAGALVTLAVGVRALDSTLAMRALALFQAMNFAVHFDPVRQLFAIGYRMADTDGSGQLVASFFDLLA